MIDLRSDTVTRPDKAMREFMMQAEVGDDVFGEDPSVIALEQLAAQTFGFDAGLFCPSGTMTNQIAIKCHTQPLDEVICDKRAHIYNYETGAWAFHSGVSIKLVDSKDGIIQAEDVKPLIQEDFDWLPNSSLLCIENTLNRGGGSYYSLEQMKKLSAFAKENNLKYHLDGARIFNALVAQNLKAADLIGLFDSVSVCLSKGLGAPVGSVLLGNKAFIKKARKVRKAFGGGMRQAGILAAAGIYALQNNVNRLAEDHEKANLLKLALQNQAAVSEILPVYTNIVIFSMKDESTCKKFVQYMAENDVKIIPFGGNSVRMVTHKDVSMAEIERVCELIKRA